MKQIRKRLTYANVMSSLAVFLVLGGATAFAAGQLGKNTVGSKQLKKNAVTAAKIGKGAVTAAKLGAGAVGAGALAAGSIDSTKLGSGSVTGDKLANGAVTGDKIANGAVTGDKIANGTVTGANINAGSTPFSQVVTRLRTNTAQLLTTTFTPYPLSGATFTQSPGENAELIGAANVVFPASCTQPRSATLYLSADSPTPATLSAEHLIGFATVNDTGTGTVTRQAQFGPFSGSALTFFEPESATTHTLSLLVDGGCTGGTSGINLTGVGFDVIGTK